MEDETSRLTTRSPHLVHLGVRAGSRLRLQKEAVGGGRWQIEKESGRAVWTLFWEGRKRELVGGERGQPKCSTTHLNAPFS